MSRSRPAATRLAALSCLLTLASAASPALGDPASRGPDLVRAEHARVVAHWTPERRAAAAPRDLVLDPRGQAYLRRPDGTLEPYGRCGVEAAGGATPNAKPGGGGGDTTAPAVSGMNPAAGQTIGASHTFSAKVTDAGATATTSLPIGAQNRNEPHVAQKPRRTFSDDWNQVTFSEPRIVKAARGTSVLAKKCPVHLRHWVQ